MWPDPEVLGLDWAELPRMPGSVLFIASAVSGCNVMADHC